MKVVVLHDRVPERANPDQSDVLVQAGALSSILSDLGYKPIEITISINSEELIDTLEAIRPVFVFNLVESVNGQGRFISLAPSLLDYLKIPYTGAKTEALFLTSNKLLAKKLLIGSGIPTLKPITLASLRFDPHCKVHGSYIIKSVWEHASLGIEEDSVISVEHPDQLFLALKHRENTLGGVCFAEQYIEGREFNISLLTSNRGVEVLPPAEIIFEDFPPQKKKVVGYRAKWVEDSFEYLHTPRSFEFTPQDASLLAKLKNIAKKCWYLFDLRGYARVDLRVDEFNNPWVLEINANPCISPYAGFVAAAAQAGLSFRQVVERIVEDTTPLLFSFNKNETPAYVY